jgi:hypothetical protein
MAFAWYLVPPLLVPLFLAIDSHLDVAPKRYRILTDMIPLLEEASKMLSNQKERLDAIKGIINMILAWLSHTTTHFCFKSVILHELSLNESLKYILDIMPDEFKEQTLDIFIAAYMRADVGEQLSGWLAPSDLQVFPNFLSIEI